ncbi:MAG: polysulfide reductase NrfD [Epsilonproteobacteria bacterium]|nr:polysulfide reductase NrfD [Campylobacterota bacterium]
MAKTKKAKAIYIWDAVRSINGSVLHNLHEDIDSLLSGGKIYFFLLIMGFLMVYAAGMFGVSAVNMGYREAYGLTREAPWGLLISTYIFFVVTSTGLCIVSSIGHVFGVKQFMPIATRAVFVSIVTIFAGFSVMLFDLDEPFHMIYSIITPNLSSNIWWMGALYGAYLVFMILEFIFLLLKRHKPAAYSGLTALIFGISAHSNLGAVFGMLHGRDFWYGPYMPIYFIASAIMSGCAAIVIFTWLGYKINNEKIDKQMEKALQSVGKLAALMIAILIFFEIWKVITGLVGSEDKRLAIFSMLNGRYAFNFLVIEILIGMIIPFIILIKTRFMNMNKLFYASILMIIGIFFMRYDLVMVGQVVPVLHGINVEEFSGLVSYAPTIYEIAISIGGLGIAIIAFLFGEKVFKGPFKGHKFGIHPLDEVWK